MSINKTSFSGSLSDQKTAVIDFFTDLIHSETYPFLTSVTYGTDWVKLFHGEDAFFKFRFDGVQGHSIWEPYWGGSIDDQDGDVGNYPVYGKLNGINYIVTTDKGIVISWDSPHASPVPESAWLTTDQNGALVVAVLGQTSDSRSTGKLTTHFWGAIDTPQYINSTSYFVGDETESEWKKWYNNYVISYYNTAMVPVANPGYQQDQYSPNLYFFKYSPFNGYVCKRMDLNGKRYFSNGMLALLDGPVPTD